MNPKSQKSNMEQVFVKTREKYHSRVTKNIQTHLLELN